MLLQANPLSPPPPPQFLKPRYVADCKETRFDEVSFNTAIFCGTATDETVFDETIFDETGFIEPVLIRRFSIEQPQM